jgi:hypothetical protein
MPGRNVDGLIRGAIISMPAGIAAFIGGAVAIAAGTVAVGEALLALGILSEGVACLLLFKTLRRARAASAAAQARWQAIRDGRDP